MSLFNEKYIAKRLDYVTFLGMSIKELTVKQAGRLGGLASTPAKAQAARRNGKKGGRPKTKGTK